jgi:3',5'-cyclic AMP phosphodiesterase CpdA
MRSSNENENSVKPGNNYNRREFLKCMTAWAGTGVVLTMSGGILSSCNIDRADHNGGTLSFVQISDTHIGFSKDPNPNPISTLQSTIEKINALPELPPFVLHTGDLTHLSRPEEFDTLAQLLKSIKTEKIFFVPGEHDVFVDQGKQFLERLGKGTEGAGWQSFDYKGTHFIGLNNVVAATGGPTPGTFTNGGSEGLGSLGRDQLDWLQRDVADLSSSTPIVVFTHVPLWSVYPQWGWATEDSAQALSYLKRFGSVTVLNGHIHQVMQKTEGNVTFHTARSTAYPQPAPGSAPSPGPMKDVPADRLRQTIGLTEVKYVETSGPLAIIDSALA